MRGKKAIIDPSGETSAVHAPARSMSRDPRVEITYVLASPSRSELARNLVLSGNHATGNQLFLADVDPSGAGIVCVSPVAINRTWIPVGSEYARYLPSGDMALPSTAFSLE